MECDYHFLNTTKEGVFDRPACHEEAIQFFMTSRCICREKARFLCDCGKETVKVMQSVYCRCASHALDNASERTDVILLTQEEYEVAKIQNA